ncbi:hypothetical protein [Paraburkholderia aspalathi]|uniref:hypothetical protein n=1 Tax=Paraburkholderia aspalathi TaxID=1324617 RepID=UPI001B232780|nr:hypothetical protein [Paraburkholderia aspalathi]MBK3838248.1 hypothetical protein [Paraburkholderia aspalathi]CAE6729226.1 hypothetical protein R69746_01959 [Paraburkholderia aspalathi]
MLRTAFRFLARVSIIPFGRPVSRSPRFALTDGRPAGVAFPLQRARAVLRTVACTLALGGALTACSPTFDWRTIMNNDNGYTVDLPAKPDNDQRAVQIDGKPMQMAMQTAEAGDAVFAVGTVMLPSDDEATQRAALEFLRTGLARNVGAAPDAHAVQIPLAAGGKVLGLEMKLSGEAGSQHETRTVYARLVARGRHVYQAAIIASKPVQQEQVDQFFSSFQLY